MAYTTHRIGNRVNERAALTGHVPVPRLVALGALLLAAFDPDQRALAEPLLAMGLCRLRGDRQHLVFAGLSIVAT